MPSTTSPRPLARRSTRRVICYMGLAFAALIIVLVVFGLSAPWLVWPPLTFVTVGSWFGIHGGSPCDSLGTIGERIARAFKGDDVA